MMENVTHSYDDRCSHCIDECDLIRYHVESIESERLGTNHSKYLFSPDLAREEYNYTKYYRYEKLVFLVFQKLCTSFSYSDWCSGSKPFCEYIIDPNDTRKDDFMELFQFEENKQHKLKELIQNLIVVNVRYPKTEARMTVLDARYSLSDKIAGFGGNFGIFVELTGISFLPLINISLIFLKLVFRFVFVSKSY